MRVGTTTRALALVLMMACGCDGGADPADAGLDAGGGMDAASGSDGGSRDAGAATDAPALPPDTGPNLSDGSIADTGPSASDAGPNDADGDGVDDAVDCDPSDADVGRLSTRACTSACGDGFESCTDGVWGACSAPTSCTCTTPGERRIATCGMCGERSEECQDGMWEPVSACLSEGTCPVGAVEEREDSRCGSSQRLCGVDCDWGDWAVVVPPGECSPGLWLCNCFMGQDYVCNDRCERVDNPDCDC